MTKQVNETAVFGGGCFWCTEATFALLKGVVSVMPGYAGGTRLHPTYNQVCGGTTGHAEVIKVEYDPGVISFKDLLAVFFSVHDPTTPNRQGNDIGTQYRSIVLYANQKQKRPVAEFIKRLEQNEFKGCKIVTELKLLGIFYPAEEYHWEYYRKNPNQGYCQLVINPKVQKLKQRFTELLKSEDQTS